LIKVLADRFAGRDWQRDFDRIGDLANSAEPALLEQMVARGQSLAVRSLGLQLILSSGAVPTYPILAAAAFDSADVADFRAHIIQALCDRDPYRFVPLLKPLLDDTRIQSEDEDVLGALLQGGFPKHLSAAEVLGALRVPKRPNTLGTFRYFWEQQFAGRVLSTDRPAALDAFAKVLGAPGFHLELRPFGDVFIEMLLKELAGPVDIPRVGPWLITVVEWAHMRGTMQTEAYQAPFSLPGDICKGPARFETVRVRPPTGRWLSRAGKGREDD